MNKAIQVFVAATLLLLNAGVNAKDVKELETKVQARSNEVKGERRRLDADIYLNYLVPNQFKPACGVCKGKIKDFNDDDSIGWDADYDNDDSTTTVTANTLLLKMKCGNPNGCGKMDDSSSDSSDVPYKFGEVACYYVDDEYDGDTLGDCTEEFGLANDDSAIMGDVDVWVDDETEISSVSCKKAQAPYEYGCGEACRLNGKTPQQCRKNGCFFVMKGKPWRSMSAERRKTCEVDLGCREWDDCNFKCEEMCKARDVCKWTGKGCANKDNFIAGTK